MCIQEIIESIPRTNYVSFIPLLDPYEQVISVMRLMKVEEVANMLGIGRSTLYGRFDCDSPCYDRDFPMPLHLGPACSRFVLLEILQYIHRKKLERSTPEYQEAVKRRSTAKSKEAVTA
jgi:predicted DNA-binding transcriptional regulator AlpA